MELQDFIQNIVNLFDDIDTSNFSVLTDFKDNDEWNSLLVWWMRNMVSLLQVMTLDRQKLLEIYIASLNLSNEL